MWRLGTLALAGLVAAGCATGPVRYPGRADVRDGDAPLIRIEATASTETAPEELRVPPGTAVVWRNATPELVFVRILAPIERVCGNPVRFSRTYDGRSFSTPFLPPFADASLCLEQPGEYPFIVSSQGRGGGASPDANGSRNGLSPVRYGKVIVE